MYGDRGMTSLMVAIGTRLDTVKMVTVIKALQ